MDFVRISTRIKPRGGMELYPKFIIKNSSEDLMIRGGDFYAVWVEERGLWSTNEDDIIRLIDRELDSYAKEHNLDPSVRILHMWDAESGMIDAWHKYCQKQLRDNFHNLNEKLIFSNDAPNKKDYASKRLPYPLEKGSCDAYEKLMSTLYSPVERRKIEWAIGAIVNGDSTRIQKFLVLYGAAGTGKSTVINIIEQLFVGYISVFDSRALGSTNNAFALESFKSNPLVAIQHDGDLSHIEDNTKLNSLVSHETMTVNNKYEKQYQSCFKAFLIMATNKPVRITDAKSGLIRRLIDVTPSGNLIPKREYDKLKEQVKFELGAIAWHCLEVYNSDPGAYDDYIPINMLGATNDFYNFVLDSYNTFKNNEGTTLKSAYALYGTYCEDARVAYPYSQRAFKEELKNYFADYIERKTLPDGTRVRNYYSGFKSSIFDDDQARDSEPDGYSGSVAGFSCATSLLDGVLSDFPAQYATAEGYPAKKWENVKTKLSDLDTTKLHYVKVPENHIVIDFDIPGDDGGKSREKNLEAASKFPPTYGEYSKSGCGVHLHYIYDGDVSKLDRMYAEHIEVKVYTGNGSLRRKFSYCNGLPIAHLKSGLPTKGEKKVLNNDIIQTEKGIRTTIRKCLNKENHGATKPEVDLIKYVLDQAYESGLHYDVRDLYNSVFIFASNSSHQADTCMKLVSQMHFKSDDISENQDKNVEDERISFFDCEVYQNLFVICWMYDNSDDVVALVNPSPEAVEEVLRLKLVGFNNRKYDNHILYARMMGYTNEQLYNLSNRLVSDNNRDACFGEAYNLSYTDIYDYSSVKQSLKKWEIDLGIHHMEMGIPWDKPVPEELWNKVVEYCSNDVRATKAVFEATQTDFTARKMLADIAGMTVNDTTNSLTKRIIFGKDRHPQALFNYRDMGDLSDEEEPGNLVCAPSGLMWVYDPDEWTRFDKQSRPIFPGYTFENGKSLYRGEDPKEGGYVYAEPGMYGNVALLDIASMHPSSIIAENLFGPYTKNFKDLVDARLYIKHKDYDSARKMLDGRLAPYLEDESSAKQLSKVLKIPINSVYGLTSAKFANEFRDPRNKDNIVAKRGALFMINLKYEVQKRGYTVAHIKTDSIKIPDATPEIIEFVNEYGRMYGYTFEHEATYDKMCIVNDAVYIAKYADEGEHEFTTPTGEKIKTPWTATGTQFKVPYVFKTLFAKAPIIFADMCETKSVTAGSIYLDMNEGYPDVSYDEELLNYIQSKDFQKVGTLDSKGKVINHKVKFRNIDFEHLDIEALKASVAKGHNYIFIGRVGLFCPMKNGTGGGVMYRYNDGKYFAVSDTTGYKWLEAEEVKEHNRQDDIDVSYYLEMCSKAIDSISKYGDFEWFVSDMPYDPDNNGIDNYPF